MNDSDEDNITGVIGELFVQLRLLEYEVQAAPPIIDSGNDLIAVKGENFKAIQVKATKGGESGNLHIERLDGKKYHIAAFVDLKTRGCTLLLDDSKIYLLSQKEVQTLRPNNISKIKDKEKYLFDNRIRTFF